MSKLSKASQQDRATQALDNPLDPRDVTFVMVEAGVSRLQAATTLADIGEVQATIDILNANRDSEGAI